MDAIIREHEKEKEVKKEKKNLKEEIQ